MGIFDRDFKPVLAVAPHLNIHKLTIGEKVGGGNLPISFTECAMLLPRRSTTLEHAQADDRRESGGGNLPLFDDLFDLLLQSVGQK